MKNRLVLEGEYLEIILELLGDRYKINSLTKLVFMSFCVRNVKKRAYMGRKKDFIDVFFASINIKLLSHPNEIKAILEVIHKLKTSGWIQIVNDEVEVLKNLKGFECANDFLISCRDRNLNPIIEVNKLDRKSFTEEVLRHV